MESGKGIFANFVVTFDICLMKDSGYSYAKGTCDFGFHLFISDNGKSCVHAFLTLRANTIQPSF
jgi:hypothetical protein